MTSIKKACELYPDLPTKAIEKLTGVKFGTIRINAHRKNLKKNYWIWSKKDMKFLLRNYKKMPMQDLMRNLDRTHWGIVNKYRELRRKYK